MVNLEVVTSIVLVAVGASGVEMREIAYRRVERNHAYGGVVYDPPVGSEPYVFEDWLP